HSTDGAVGEEIGAGVGERELRGGGPEEDTARDLTAEFAQLVTAVGEERASVARAVRGPVAGRPAVVRSRQAVVDLLPASQAAVVDPQPVLCTVEGQGGGSAQAQGPDGAE